MKFPNSYLCVKKLFTAEIFNIISTVFLLTASLFTFCVSEEDKTSAEFGDTFIITWIILTVLYAFFSVIAFILQLIGLNRGRKEDKMFRDAMAFVIVCMMTTLILVFVRGVFGDIVSTIDMFATLFVHVYIIMGIYSVAYQLGYKSVQSRGKVTFFIMIGIFAFAIIVSILPAFIPDLEEPLSFAAPILELLGHLVLITYIAMGKKLLGSQGQMHSQPA